MCIVLLCFLKTKHINLKPNTYTSVLAMGTFVFLQYLKEKEDRRGHLYSHISSSFYHEAKDKISPSFPSLHPCKRKEMGQYIT